MRGRGWALVALMAPTWLAFQSTPSRAASDVEYTATSFAQNAQHTLASGMRLAPTAALRWTRDLHGLVSYPLIVGGRVFVTVGNATPANPGAYGSKLYALDARNGATLWGPIALAGPYDFSATAYDNGRIYVVSDEDRVRAFDAVTGGLVWNVPLEPGWNSAGAPLTASGGVVYVPEADSGGRVLALDESDGSALWSVQLDYLSSFDPPAVDGSRLFMSGACEQTYAVNLTGSVAWHHNTSCFGGGGRSNAAYKGHVYVRGTGTNPGPNVVLRASNGAPAGTFTGASNSAPPSFMGDHVYVLSYSDRTLRAQSLSTGQALWSFAASGHLISAPFSVGGYVYVGSTTGSLFVLDPATGKVVAKKRLGAPASPMDENSPAAWATMAAGDGLLVVPATNRLVAFG